MGIRHIEYNQNYALIHLEGDLMEQDICQKLREEVDNIASLHQDVHFIFGMKEVENISLEVCHYFETLHHYLYEKGVSVVFAELNENILKKFKQEQLHLVLNITPTIIEASDIINMEILERDILNEE